MFRFLKPPFSPFARIPDLTLYNLDELSKLARKMKKTTWSQDQFVYAEWSDSYTIIQMRFNPNGTFNKLVKEEWKDLNVLFDYEKIAPTKEKEY
ncbi:MAG: hypothetical protein ACKOWQ_09745 [Aquirufa sp.]